MELKNSKIFSKETILSVTTFCESQEIKDVDNFIYLCFKQGFDIKKYGFLGGEVTVEIIKEVEKIVEVIKEVPVEILVEKKIYTTDDTQINELLLKIEQLEKKFSTKASEIKQLEEEFSTKTSEMENIFQNKMSKKDEELDKLRRNLDVILDEPPVEVIKEVEKPNDKMGMLQETLQSIRKELQIKNERIKELEKINRDLENINTQPKSAVYLRGSNLNSRM
jgi:hypothetical protein